MSVHPAIRRLNTDLRHLAQSRKEKHQDSRELRKDERALKSDQKAVGTERKDLKQERKVLGKERASLERTSKAEQSKLAGLEARKAILEQRYTDSFDPADPTQPGDPAVLGEIQAVEQREADVEAKFGAKIDPLRRQIDRGHQNIDGGRKFIDGKRRELKGDRRELKADRRALDKDGRQVKNERQDAMKHLRPAEYHMGLKATNRARHQLGLKAVDSPIRPGGTGSVKACAQFLLSSNNVSFWSGLSTGSDRKNLERLARGEKAYVPATGGYVTPNLKMMQALVDMAKHGPIMINALTGGSHSVGSNHYSGTAVDLDVGVGSASEIASIANKYGGYRNYETSHIHLDF
ncbi:MAG: hypothetical protein ACYC8T_06640 [Myxococcaceae bacterium]